MSNDLAKKSYKISIIQKFFIGLGLFFGLIILLFISQLFLAIKDGKTLDRESQEYVNKVLPDIFDDWDHKLLYNNADSEFRNVLSSYELKEFMDSISSKLGKMKVYEGAQGESKTMIMNFKKNISANYSANFKFENGPASVTVNLIKINDKWYIHGINFDSPAFLSQN